MTSCGGSTQRPSRWRPCRGTARILFAIVITVAAGAPSVPAHADESSGPPRIVALDWALAQTLIGLGVRPVGIANTRGYREWANDPPLPAATVDVGRRMQPHLATLASLEPDLVLLSPYMEQLAERVAGIAPVESHTIFHPDRNPLERALGVARTLADRLQRPAAMAAMEARLERAVATLRSRVPAGSPPPSVYVVQFTNRNHLRVFASGSLFHAVLERAGLRNAWQGGANHWGFASTGVTELDAPADHLVVIDPVPRTADAMMADSLVWHALPAVRHGQVHRMPPVWSFGGAPSAIRFAEQLGRALDDEG